MAMTATAPLIITSLQSAGLFHPTSSGRKWIPSRGGQQWPRLSPRRGAPAALGVQLSLELFNAPPPTSPKPFHAYIRRNLTIAHICCNFSTERRAEECPLGCPAERGHQFFSLPVKGLLPINKPTLSLTASFSSQRERPTEITHATHLPHSLVSFHKVKMSSALKSDSEMPWRDARNSSLQMCWRSAWRDLTHTFRSALFSSSSQLVWLPQTKESIAPRTPRDRSKAFVCLQWPLKSHPQIPHSCFLPVFKRKTQASFSDAKGGDQWDQD